MRDFEKPDPLEWAGCVLNVLGFVGVLLGAKFLRMLPPEAPSWIAWSCLFLMLAIGLVLLAIGSNRRTEKIIAAAARRSAEADAWLRFLKEQYPPGDNVLHHLHQLGYHNVYRYVSELKSTLEWVATNYKTTLANKPVRDADECLSRADYLTRK
jgi:hypothetical protein